MLHKCVCHSALQLIKLFFLYSIFWSAFPFPIHCFPVCHFFFFLWPHCMASGILVPKPGIEPRPSVVKARSPNLGYQGAPPCPFLSSVITLPPFSAQTERPPEFFLFSTHCDCLTGPRKKIVHH